MTQRTAFARLSQGVAKEFLNSIVVVDDRARFDTSSPPARTLRRPGRAGAALPDSNATPEQFHELDAKQIIDNFAATGIICAVIKPQGRELRGIAQQLARAAHSADVVVLDWVLLNYKEGEKTIEMIRMLAQQARGERSRLVIVYTGETNLRAITTAIKDALGPAAKTQEDDCTVLHRGLRVAVYAKHGSTVSHDLRRRVVASERLPDTVIKEFAKMTTGLLANVALKSMAVIRDDTFRILQKFNRATDAAYVTHHVLQAPEGAASHLVPLVVSEIQAVLEDHEVESIATAPRIKVWLSDQFQNGLAPFPNTNARDSKAALNALIAEGPTSDRIPQNSDVSRFLKSKGKAAKEIRDGLTKLLSLESQDIVDYDRELAILMSIRSRYRSPRPRLTLGTIVQETSRNQKQYLLCLQPRCDSVRIKDDVRTFPFLPLKEVTEGRFDIVVSDSGQSRKLVLTEQPYAMRLIAFCANAVQQEVLGRRARGGSYFPASQIKRTYRWVADLKADHAQRVAHNCASKLSRVGLTESEWLRRWALD